MRTGETCPYCGELEEVELLDLWIEDRAFTLSTCCESSYELWLEEMRHWDRKDWEAFMAEEAAVQVRQVTPEFTLDYGVEVGPVDLNTAKDFVRRHHRHTKPPVSWRWGHGIYNGRELIGVVMVGRPVARMIDGTTTVEVNRLCVNPNLEPGLVWNACSKGYGAAAKEARRRGFARIITYTLETEDATSLKAVGWNPAALTKGGSWNRPSRERTDKAPTCRKVRWERDL